MNEIAEKARPRTGAARMRAAASQNLDSWLVQVREMLDGGETDTVDYVDEFKLNLKEEIPSSRPNGDLFNLPKGATTSTSLGTPNRSRCTAPRSTINSYPPLRWRALTRSKSYLPKQNPKEDQLRGHSQCTFKIRHALRDEECTTTARTNSARMRRKEIAQRANIDSLMRASKMTARASCFYIATGDPSWTVWADLRSRKTSSFDQDLTRASPTSQPSPAAEQGRRVAHWRRPAEDRLQPRQLLQPHSRRSRFGFVMVAAASKCTGKTVQRHQPSLQVPYRAMKAQWTSRTANFEVTLNFTGIDDVASSPVTKVISDDMHVNMRAISFDQLTVRLTGA